MSIDSSVKGNAAASAQPYGIIYCAMNRVNGKRYIGQTTKTLHKRRQFHGYQSKVANAYFNKAVQKYGLDGFEWTEIDKAYSREDINQKERYWIGFYNTMDPSKGYNSDEGGYRTKATPEICAKMSAKRLESERNRVGPHPFVGKALPKETRLKISVAKRTKNKTKISQPNKIGKHYSKATEFPSVAIRCIETGDIYPSLTQAAKAIGVHHVGFSKYFKGERQSVAGLHWEKVPNFSV